MNVTVEHEKSAVVYLHGKGGNAGEAEHYSPLFPECDVIGFDYRADTPWDAKEEFPAFFDGVRQKSGTIILIANSIGAFFAMSALGDREIGRAYFISPVVDMQQLIEEKMKWSRISEEDLRKKKTIRSPDGDPLSWEYLCYVRRHPPEWHIPTHILYGEKDALTPVGTMRRFAKKAGATLRIMPGGEHWFHTGEQMAFLDRWIKDIEDAESAKGAKA